MNFEEYQLDSYRTLQCDMTDIELKANCALGIAGEAGELADYLKKILFHGHPVRLEKLREELGDLLWYVSALCSIYGISLDDVGKSNIEKLWRRYPNGFSRRDSQRRRDERI